MMLKHMNGPSLKTKFQPASEVSSPEDQAGEVSRRKAELTSSLFADAAFRYLMLGCALSVLAIVVLIVRELIIRSTLSLHAFGLKFFFRQAWDPVNGDFGALPFIYGTLVSSFLALLLALHLSVGVATFLTRLCLRN